MWVVNPSLSAAEFESNLIFEAKFGPERAASFHLAPPEVGAKEERNPQISQMQKSIPKIWFFCEICGLSLFWFHGFRGFSWAISSAHEKREMHQRQGPQRPNLAAYSQVRAAGR